MAHLGEAPPGAGSPDPEHADSAGASPSLDLRPSLGKAPSSSFLRVTAICGNTLTELTRLKVFYLLLFFGVLLISGSVFLARFSFQQEFQILKDISLGAMSILTSLLAILAAARLIPQELEDRTIYTILAKPVPRYEYIIGRLAGVLTLLGITVLALSALFFLVLYVREQSVLHDTTLQMTVAPKDQLAQALQMVHASAFNWNLVPAVAAIYLRACVLAALTLFISTFATTNVFTVVVMVFVYFIGHLQGVAREYWLHEHGGGWLTWIFLAVVSLVFPDLQAFNLVDEAVAGTLIPFGLFFRIAALALVYVIVYAALAAVSFSGREL
jgi:ABC-type Na+ efflux pump permease subunit